MEVECLKYCDPNTVLVDSAAFRRNGLMVIYLYRRLYPALQRQNRCRTSTLTLYMEVLLRCLYEDVVTVDEALEEYSRDRDRDAYYRKVLRLDRCDRHDTLEVRFTRKVGLNVTLATLNDIERFFCKINCAYGTLSPDCGLDICRKVLRLLGRLCGISPVTGPEAYTENEPCRQCYEELAAIPNQGRSISRRLQGLLCDHVTVKKPLVQLETDIQTIEQDILEEVGHVPRISGIVSAIRNLSSLSPASHTYINEAEEALRDYNLFTDIPRHIYSLSDFTYWSKTSEIIVKRVGLTVRQLNLHHGLCKTLQNELSRYLYGEDVEDVFSVGEGRFAEDERLFAGSIFASPGRVVDLITSMSIKCFEENPLFHRLHESNETYAKIKALIEKIRGQDSATTSSSTGETEMRAGTIGGVAAGDAPEVEVTKGRVSFARRSVGAAARKANSSRVRDVLADAEDGEVSRPTGPEVVVGKLAGRDLLRSTMPVALEPGDQFMRTHDIVREVNVRRRAYLRKVSEAGYNKVMRCIKGQEDLITKLVSVNLVGTVCLEALSKLMNGWLRRRRYLVAVEASDVGDFLTYDDHLYIVNNLIHRSLPIESLPTLGQQIYRFINGPVFTHHGEFYPLPYNIDMAYACDNANMLPHAKDDLVRCAEGTAHPGEWMVSGYQRFFDFEEAADFNAMQKMYWAHVRELVLSVALYNEVFAQNLIIHRADDPCHENVDGLVLTYNTEWPLFLRCGSETYRSRDLYLLLYQYLGASRDRGSEFASPSASESSGHANESDDNPYPKRRRHGRVTLSDLARCPDGDDDVFIPNCLIGEYLDI